MSIDGNSVFVSYDRFSQSFRVAHGRRQFVGFEVG